MIISNDPVPSKTEFSIRGNLEPDSTIIDASHSILIKYPGVKISTDPRIRISIKSIPMTPEFSIHDNREPCSDSTYERDVHSEKPLSQRVSSDKGIIMGIKPVSKCGLCQSVIISTLITKEPVPFIGTSHRRFQAMQAW
jgi:hypothetical protein